MFNASRQQSQKRARRLGLAARWSSNRLRECLLESFTKSSGAGAVRSGAGWVSGFGSTVVEVGVTGVAGALGSGLLTVAGVT